MSSARVALLLLLAGCGSSSPYTLASAIVNTSVAVGAAVVQRAAGGCVATCTNGTACNARTGLCERVVSGDASDPRAVCVEEPGGGGMRCAPAIEVQRPPAPPSPVGVGVSPATGSAPPPPAEASPRSGP